MQTSRAAKDRLEELCVMAADWPPLGADMNITENVLGIMKSKLSRKGLHNAGCDELWRSVQDGWDLLKMDRDLIPALLRLSSATHGSGCRLVEPLAATERQASCDKKSSIFQAVEMIKISNTPCHHFPLYRASLLRLSFPFLFALKNSNKLVPYKTVTKRLCYSSEDSGF